MRRLAIRVDVDSGEDRERTLAYVKAAEEAGVEAVFVAETWGRDAFTTLTRLAIGTTRISLGTGIVNVFSRSPAALAQQFATLDELSEGRVIAGLGTSGRLVVEQFHGVSYQRPATRLRETIRIVRLLVAGQQLRFDGQVFRFERGFTLRFPPFRATIPIYLASFRPAGVRIAAELADGWLPTMIPIDRLAQQVGRLREQVAAAGRDPASVVVRAPGNVVVARDVAAARQAQKRRLAYYLARMGDYYHTHLSGMGRADEVTAIRQAWEDGGSAAGMAAVSDDLDAALAAVGTPDDLGPCLERLDAQAAGGVDLHQVVIRDVDEPAELRRLFERLGRGSSPPG